MKSHSYIARLFFNTDSLDRTVWGPWQQQMYFDTTVTKRIKHAPRGFQAIVESSVSIQMRSCEAFATQRIQTHGGER